MRLSGDSMCDRQWFYVIRLTGIGLFDRHLWTVSICLDPRSTPRWTVSFIYNCCKGVDKRIGVTMNRTLVVGVSSNLKACNRNEQRWSVPIKRDCLCDVYGKLLNTVKFIFSVCYFYRVFGRLDRFNLTIIDLPLPITVDDIAICKILFSDPFLVSVGYVFGFLNLLYSNYRANTLYLWVPTRGNSTAARPEAGLQRFVLVSNLVCIYW